jgi:fluoride exporter
MELHSPISDGDGRLNGNIYFDRSRRRYRDNRTLLPIVNVTGSFIIGFFAALTGPDGRVYVSSTGRQFVMTGICGGYTTFSSFSLQTLSLMNDGEWFRAGANMGLSLVFCLIAVWAGFLLASMLNTMKWT